MENEMRDELDGLYCHSLSLSTSGRETLIFIQKTERKLKENEIPVMAFISGPCLLNLIL